MSLRNMRAKRAQPQRTVPTNSWNT